MLFFFLFHHLTPIILLNNIKVQENSTKNEREVVK